MSAPSEYAPERILPKRRQLPGLARRPLAGRREISNEANLQAPGMHHGDAEDTEMNVNAILGGSYELGSVNSAVSVAPWRIIAGARAAGIWAFAGFTSFRIMAGEIGSIVDRRGMIEESVV